MKQIDKELEEEALQKKLDKASLLEHELRGKVLDHKKLEIIKENIVEKPVEEKPNSAEKPISIEKKPIRPPIIRPDNARFNNSLKYLAILAILVLIPIITFTVTSGQIEHLDLNLFNLNLIKYQTFLISIIALTAFILLQVILPKIFKTSPTSKFRILIIIGPTLFIIGYTILLIMISSSVPTIGDIPSTPVIVSTTPPVVIPSTTTPGVVALTPTVSIVIPTPSAIPPTPITVTPTPLVITSTPTAPPTASPGQITPDKTDLTIPFFLMSIFCVLVIAFLSSYILISNRQRDFERKQMNQIIEVLNQEKRELLFLLVQQQMAAHNAIQTIDILKEKIDLNLAIGKLLAASEQSANLHLSEHKGTIDKILFSAEYKQHRQEHLEEILTILVNRQGKVEKQLLLTTDVIEREKLIALQKKTSLEIKNFETTLEQLGYKLT